jgi:3-hydroxymyristoyl/3-hydroxydecanoyl-(acyl carrier protein) dehydratase
MTQDPNDGAPFLVARSDITMLIPHRQPMLMIDNLVSAESRKTRTSFTVREDNIFIESGIFQEHGLMENMAQTAAAGAGWNYLEMGKERPPTYFAAVSRLSIETLPAVGDTLETETEIQHILAGMALIRARVNIGNKCIARCEMKVSGNFAP